MNKCRILVFGAGVIGSNLAADLFASGCDVTLLARGEWADIIEKTGLTIQSAFLPGKRTYRIPVIRELRADNEFDVIFDADLARTCGNELRGQRIGTA